MDETIIPMVGVCALIPSLVYSFFYSIGGRNTSPWFPPRLWRRLIAPMSFSLSCIFLSFYKKFHLAYLFFIPSFVLAHSLIKYGSGNLFNKLGGRFLSGVWISLSILPISIASNSLNLWAIQAYFAMGAHVIIGILNPVEAGYEEILISIITIFIVPFMVL